MAKEQRQEEQQRREPLIVKAVKTLAKDATLGGAARQGLKDVQDVMLQAFPDSHKSRDEPGTIANPTSAIVTSQILGRDPNRMTMAEFNDFAREQNKEPSKERGREGREGKGRDRGIEM
ncbi:MAG: hypothetical protein U0793_12715 [Gemmataceae bacterium]